VTKPSTVVVARQPSAVVSKQYIPTVAITKQQSVVLVKQPAVAIR
jgi:hypothetical protein